MLVMMVTGTGSTVTIKKCIYVFLRKDLSLIQQTVQASHVCLEAGRKFKLEDERYKIIIFGIRSESKLKTVISEILRYGFIYVTFTEPDLQNAMTAVATEPLNAEQGAIFNRYRLLDLP